MFSLFHHHNSADIKKISFTNCLKHTFYIILTLVSVKCKVYKVEFFLYLNVSSILFVVLQEVQLMVLILIRFIYCTQIHKIDQLPCLLLISCAIKSLS